MHRKNIHDMKTAATAKQANLSGLFSFISIKKSDRRNKEYKKRRRKRGKKKSSKG